MNQVRSITVVLRWFKVFELFIFAFDDRLSVLYFPWRLDFDIFLFSQITSYEFYLVLHVSQVQPFKELNGLKMQAINTFFVDVA